MSEREAFLLRMDRKVLDAVRRWARDDLRSVNGQVEFILREAVRRRKRINPPADEAKSEE